MLILNFAVTYFVAAFELTNATWFNLSPTTPAAAVIAAVDTHAFEVSASVNCGTAVLPAGDEVTKAVTVIESVVASA